MNSDIVFFKAAYFDTHNCKNLFTLLLDKKRMKGGNLIKVFYRSFLTKLGTYKCGNGITYIIYLFCPKKSQKGGSPFQRMFLAVNFLKTLEFDAHTVAFQYILISLFQIISSKNIFFGLFINKSLVLHSHFSINYLIFFAVFKLTKKWQPSSDNCFSNIIS